MPWRMPGKPSSWTSISVPRLRVRDRVELLEIYLPRRAREPDDVLAAMSLRHQARQKAIDSAHKNTGNQKLF